MRLRVRDISLFERPVPFARPFRFGAVVVEKATQAFVRIEIETEQGRRAVGGAAELLAPKWFDKRPHLSSEETIDELRTSLAIARELYLSGTGFDTAFGIHAGLISAQAEACQREDIPALAAAFGPAEIDKAVLDALLRCAGLSFQDGMRRNIAGIDARLSSDLTDEAVASFLSTRVLPGRIAIRHTVGLTDRIEGEGGVADLRENAGARYFKLKLGGDPVADAARLTAIGRQLQTLPHAYTVTVDANEQYSDSAALGDLVERLDGDPDLRPITERLLYIEQPMARDVTWHSPLGGMAKRDFIIDEADDSYDAFPMARLLGYRGVSSKSCKGLYKSVINATRAAKWSLDGGTYFIAGEDLTCQPGLALQQDLALGALIGISHAERNGHHYVDGFTGTPEAEAAGFMAAHPDLYAFSDGVVKLVIPDGTLSTGSLNGAGFASAAMPDWSSLAPMQQPARRNTQEQSA